MNQESCKMRDGQIEYAAFGGRVQPLKDLFGMPFHYFLQGVVVMQMGHRYIFILLPENTPS
jgi:hypothetical protein